MLGTPPAFILSQDQTLQFELACDIRPARANATENVRLGFVAPPRIRTRGEGIDVEFVFYLVFKEPTIPLAGLTILPEPSAAVNPRRHAGLDIRAHARTHRPGRQGFKERLTRWIAPNGAGETLSPGLVGMSTPGPSLEGRGAGIGPESVSSTNVPVETGDRGDHRDESETLQRAFRDVNPFRFSGGNGCRHDPVSPTRCLRREQ